jgi:hypothetical protein
MLRLIRLAAFMGAACGLCRAQLPANLLPVVDVTGVYIRSAAEDVKIVAVSESGLTLECTLKNVQGQQPVTWREKYSVRNGRLVLDAVLAPHVVPPQPAHTEWLVSSTIGTSNVGPMVMDPHWKNFRDYLQNVIQTVQDAWSTQLSEIKIPSSSGSVVSVAFILNSKGEISQILGAHPSADAPPEVIDPCVAAIKMNGPYGGWTDDMIAALGTEQKLTFTFSYP